MLGSLDSFGTGDTDDVPMRLAAVPPFLVDKYEVTVARWRAAVAAGFVSPDPMSPTSNPQPIPSADTPGVTEASDVLCTWSGRRPGPRPSTATSIRWSASRGRPRARSVSGWAGTSRDRGAWEYLASAAGGRPKTRYPWGGSDATLPTCARAVYGRGLSTGIDNLCNVDGGAFGPLPVTTADDDGGDRTPAISSAASFVVGLGGSETEWMLDELASFNAGCWLGAPVVSPSCIPAQGTSRVIRGGYWASTLVSLVAAQRQTSGGGPSVGFRCVAPGAP